jgi:hypothetical protein
MDSSCYISERKRKRFCFLRLPFALSLSFIREPQLLFSLSPGNDLSSKVAHILRIAFYKICLRSQFLACSTRGSRRMPREWDVPFIVLGEPTRFMLTSVHPWEAFINRHSLASLGRITPQTFIVLVFILALVAICPMATKDWKIEWCRRVS